TEALISYIQLLTQQIFVQQLTGQTGREMTPTEIDHLVQDQLRLLIHLGYLADLWAGGGPDPDIGEGQWLFIERYSLRVAQRLDSLILETHNVGLVVDLLVALQLHNTALAALAGDADFAAADAATWRDFLAVLVGDDQPQGFGYHQAQPPFWWDEALAMGDYNPAWLSEVEPEPAAIALAQAEALTRVKGLATPLWFPQQQELDPTAENDVAQIIFHTAPMDLPPGVMDIISQNLPGGLLDFVWGVLTGQSDNWWAIGANITLSFVPIFGIVFDFISFMIEPSGWGKAFALIGLVASIITDGAEVLTAVGALVPVSLAATVPGVVLLEVIDGGAAVLKGVNHFVSTSTWNALKKIPFKKVLTKIGPDLIGFLGRKATEVVGAGSWPTSISGFLDLLISVRDKVWTPFSNWFTKRGVPNGFGEGEYLAGRVLATSDEAASYSDEALDSLVKIGDDLAQGGVELSDEAAQGLGKLVNDIGGEKAQRFLKALPCSPGLAQVTSRSAGLASPLLQTPGECQELALKFFKDLPVDDPARTGFSQLVDVVPVEDAIKIFQNKYDDAARLKILGTLSNHWDEFAELPRKVDTERVLDLFAQFEAEDVLKMIKNTDGDEGLDVFAKVLNSGKYDEVLQHLANAHLIKTSPGPGQGFEFHSAFKVGINDDTILLKQIDEIQTSMMSKYGRGDNFEDVSWNCGRCQKYHARIKEMLPTNAPPLEYGNTSGPIAYDVKVDGIGVGDYHIAFEDAQGNIWDPATNTWGQPKEIYDTRVDEIVKE
ncbi:MAG: hypothetical protein GY796_05405, partial [Chloroflexi bacterium]|nr:hypothetical protein [Chloroflexota bacterium]